MEDVLLYVICLWSVISDKPPIPEEMIGVLLINDSLAIKEKDSKTCEGITTASIFESIFANSLLSKGPYNFIWYLCRNLKFKIFLINGR